MVQELNPALTSDLPEQRLPTKGHFQFETTEKDFKGPFRQIVSKSGNLEVLYDLFVYLNVGAV